MSARLPCLVPFCRRTAPAEKYGPGAEIICGKHWRNVDRRLRRMKAQARRRGRVDLEHRIWAWCRDQAVARAAMP